MKKFVKNIKISHVFVFMTLLTVAFIAGRIYHSIADLKKAHNYVQTLKDDHLEPMMLLQDILNDYSINIVKNSSKVRKQVTNWQQELQNIQETQDNIKAKWALYSSKITGVQEKEQALKINILMARAETLLSRINHVAGTTSAKELDELIASELYPAILPITEALEKAIEEQNTAINKLAEESYEVYNKTRTNTRNIGIGIIIIILLLATFIVVTLSRTLKSANDSIKRIAEGDLTVEIEGYGNDEIGTVLHNIKHLVKNLRSIIEIINAAATNIAVTSHELSSNSQEISQGSTEQAASVEQMAASMEEISANIIQNAKNARLTEQISEQAGNEFENGRENIDSTVNSIHTIASKISIIGEIAFQTNILALNAAVEAARAGEHGKGFGVVAAEVGKLAERSKVAAAEINQLSKSGVDLSMKSKELLNIALPNINKTIQLVKEISSASSEQSSGVDQINSGIQTLNHVTQQNAAASEEMATVAEELAAQAEQLSNSISFFNIGLEQTPEKKKPFATKYIEQKSSLKNHQPENKKGINLDLDSQDDLDDEFETF